MPGTPVAIPPLQRCFCLPGGDIPEQNSVFRIVQSNRHRPTIRRERDMSPCWKLELFEQNAGNDIPERECVVVAETRKEPPAIRRKSHVIRFIRIEITVIRVEITRQDPYGSMV